MDNVHRHRADVAEILGELSALSEPLTVEGMGRIVVCYTQGDVTRIEMRRR